MILDSVEEFLTEKLSSLLVPDQALIAEMQSGLSVLPKESPAWFHLDEQTTPDTEDVVRLIAVLFTTLSWYAIVVAIYTVNL